MILGGAEALTIHWCDTDDFGILAVSGYPVRVLRTHVQGTCHPTRRRRTAGGSGPTRAMTREVGAEIEVEITAPTTLEYQIAVAPHPRAEVVESLCFVVNGRPVRPLEVSGVHGNRIHKFDAAVGSRKVNYAATILGQTDPAPVTNYDLLMYLRPSRYAEADNFDGLAATEFDTYGDSAMLLEDVSSWVGTRLNYVPGSSDPIDGAVDTLLSGKGVCRDYAHLVVALLRAVNVPARLGSAYAPGVYPMDFHAVA